MAWLLVTWRRKEPEQQQLWHWLKSHYNDVIMDAMASQITSLAVVYATVYSGADQRKHQSSASLAFVRGIHRRPLNSPHKGPVTRKMFPFDDVIMARNISAGFNSWSVNLIPHYLPPQKQILSEFFQILQKSNLFQHHTAIHWNNNCNIYWEIKVVHCKLNSNPCNG